MLVRVPSMQTEMNDHESKAVEELLAPALGVPHVQDNITYSIQRLVIQCGALLRQQLERRARNGGSECTEADVDRIMFEFQATSSQIEATIADEVTTFALERMGRVFHNAHSDGVDALEALMWSAGVAPPHVGQNGAALDPGPTLAAGRAPAQPPSRPMAAPKAAPPPQYVPPGPGRMATLDAAKDAGSQEEQRSRGDAFPVPVRASPGKTYQGAVSLSIESGGDAGEIVNFINALRRTPGVLLTQLMGDSHSGSSIMLKIPVPMPLRDVLLGMEGVSQVGTRASADGKSGGPVLTVQLA